MPGVKGRSGGANIKSVAQHRRAGTFRPDRHGGFSNPAYPAGAPEPPHELIGVAANTWDRIVDALGDTGMLSTADGDGLYQYCQLFAETDALEASKASTAATIRLMETELARVRREDVGPLRREVTKLRRLEGDYVSKIRQGRVALFTFLRELGLTPASRGRVKLPEQPLEDEFSQFERPTAARW